jgi:hypothetical protein
MNKNSLYPPPAARKRLKPRGVVRRIDGSVARFALHRDGLHVRRGRRSKERVVSFADLFDLAEGQFRMNL